MKKILSAAAVMILGGLWAGQARAHCQVPCGIYDDAARVQHLREHITTIDKAVKQIGQLTRKKDAQSQNQLVRWVVTKEQHADKIIRTISDYFLTQKIKPATKGGDQAAYLRTLARHHAVMVAAMKCKQTVSSGSVKALKQAVDGIAGYWKKK